jgi:hypothetical protein
MCGVNAFFELAFGTAQHELGPLSKFVSRQQMLAVAGSEHSWSELDLLCPQMP